MVDVNPVYLAAGAVALVVIVAIVVGNMSKPQPVPVVQQEVVKTEVKKPKRKKAKKKAVQTPEPAAVTPKPVEEDSVPEVKAPVKPVPKKKNKKSKAAAPAPKPAPKPTPKPEPVVVDSDSSDDEFVPSVPVVAKKAKKESKKEPAPKAPVTVETEVSMASEDDGWTVVQTKQSKRAEKKAAIAANVVESPVSDAADSPAAEPVDFVVTQVEVPIKKIGTIIGTKGSTIQAIEQKSSAKMDIPADRSASGTVNVQVSGTRAAVASAAMIITDLTIKGFSSQLTPDVIERRISIPQEKLRDVIGKEGYIIKRLQSTGVRVDIASSSSSQGENVSATLIGLKEDIVEVKAAIQSLLDRTYSSLTHPGTVHREVAVDAEHYRAIIGVKGSEMRNIENSHNVRVFIPTAKSVYRDVMVTGLPSNVDAGVNHIMAIIARLNAADEKVKEANEDWQASAEEPLQPWMREYVFDRSRPGVIVPQDRVEGAAWLDATVVDSEW